MRKLLSTALIGTMLAALPAAAQEPIDRAMLTRIKDEGLQRSRAQANSSRSGSWKIALIAPFA